METIEKLLPVIGGFVIEYGMKLLGAIIIFIIGSWVIKYIRKIADKFFINKKLDESLRGFALSMIVITLKVLLFITVLSIMGVEMTSFVALLGAAGLAVGMALSGTLQNFAGGVMILLFKPFKVGDFVDAQGYKGTVKEIQIFNTIVTTPDNKTAIIPNGGLSTSAITNFSTQTTRRVDLVFGVGYNTNIQEAIKLINQAVEADSRILKDPKPFVRLSEMADSSLNIASRSWVKSADYWDVYFDTIETVHKLFVENNIEIPFPQMDVHIQNQ